MTGCMAAPRRGVQPSLERGVREDLRAMTPEQKKPDTMDALRTGIATTRDVGESGPSESHGGRGPVWLESNGDGEGPAEEEGRGQGTEEPCGCDYQHSGSEHGPCAAL